ncbi:hypothetical protein ASPACDRAFT_82366 [Aspergillus aculeatus ATCC 16872]|uniref:Uncharacterized protein n=1 Tax=Aspergillus aculeatus (strain ATCC 16872 / CBS 172.66 / WB 5094) TaxID=690307 RepID=A0A1L9WFD0_ASPA1|nr:uncharacterized protein ASPACDRAFT_82366 [Aspergillus aculeatus ATCC 16872]OJJ94896.1 hypothetical protein ASPACDRAFT_82366 [Aspergillus aculeatus ATCC 16872]
MDVPDDKHDHSSLLRLLHPSVGSFLRSPTRCTDERFRIDSKQAHYDAMEGCLRLLPDILERGQKEKVGSTSDRSDLMVDTGDACTVWEWSPAARYACRYWVKHLERSRVEAHPGDSFSLFIENHIPRWLKALVQVESIDEASKDLQYLASFISKTGAYELGTSLRELSLSLAERKAQVEQNPSMIYQLVMEHLDRCN